MGNETKALSLNLDLDALKPLIAAVVTATLDAREAGQAQVGEPGRLAYGEAEAARLLGLHTHQLRDMRLRGEIACSRIVGNRVAYQRSDLVKYLEERRVK